ncbi:hypothetical protein DSUL_100122 [Desulfovibrionales bacterium]
MRLLGEDLCADFCLYSIAICGYTEDFFIFNVFQTKVAKFFLKKEWLFGIGTVRRYK